MRISDWSSDVCSSDLADVRHDDAAASAHDYPRHVRDVDADTPARFNADPRCLFEASGSAGKMMVFAVRLDTIEGEQQSTSFRSEERRVGEESVRTYISRGAPTQ